MSFVKSINEGIRKIIDGQDRKKIIENSIIVIIIGIIFLVAGSTILKNKDSSYSRNNNQNNLNNLSNQNLDDDNNSNSVSTSKSITSSSIEKEMEEILSQIEGVGKVSVMITYESGREIIPAYDKRQNINETKEEDSNGGKRAIMQSDAEDKIAYEEQQGGTKKPIILKELEPKVKGVVVVAEGANEAVVIENLVKAVQALVDVPTHKIQVFTRTSK